MKDCFRDSSRLEILTGTYQVPHGYLYSNDVLNLLSLMLEPTPVDRPDIHEVISFVDALTSGNKSLPPRQCNAGNVSSPEPLPRPSSLIDLENSHRHVSVSFSERLTSSCLLFKDDTDSSDDNDDASLLRIPSIRAIGTQNRNDQVPVRKKSSGTLESWKRKNAHPRRLSPPGANIKCILRFERRGSRLIFVLCQDAHLFPV